MRSSCTLLVDSDVITDFSARANQRVATKTSGHDRPESPVTIDQNTHFNVHAVASVTKHSA